MTPRSLILMKAFWFYGRFSGAMSFSKFATPVSTVTIDVLKISIVWLPRGKVSALALKSEDTCRMNKEKHSLHNFAVLQSGGSYSKTFLPTSIMSFHTKEANFQNKIASENGSRIKMPFKSKSLILVAFCWKKNFLRINTLTNLI